MTSRQRNAGTISLTADMNYEFVQVRNAVALPGRVRTIRAEAEELRAEPQPRPSSAAPTDDPERTLLLFCPEQGGWQTGVFLEGRWLDFATLTVELEPAHFTDGPPDPD